MDAALPWGGHEEPAELPKLAANDRGARGRVDPGGLDQGGGWIGALSTSNAIIAITIFLPAGPCGSLQTCYGRSNEVVPAAIAPPGGTWFRAAAMVAKAKSKRMPGSKLPRAPSGALRMYGLASAEPLDAHKPAWRRSGGFAQRDVPMGPIAVLLPGCTAATRALCTLSGRRRHDQPL